MAAVETEKPGSTRLVELTLHSHALVSDQCLTGRLFDPRRHLSVPFVRLQIKSAVKLNVLEATILRLATIAGQGLTHHYVEREID